MSNIKASGMIFISCVVSLGNRTKVMIRFCVLSDITSHFLASERKLVTCLTQHTADTDGDDLWIILVPMFLLT